MFLHMVSPRLVRAGGCLIRAKLAASPWILFFPLLPVELLHDHALDRTGIEAARVDAEPVRVRARDVEGFYAADGAKQVLGRVRVEPVGVQNLAPAEKLETLGRDDEVQVSGLAANRTVAFGYPEFRRSADLEPHASAVTTAGVEGHRVGWQNRVRHHGVMLEGSSAWLIEIMHRCQILEARR